jgi:DNA-binding transcriptional ArsR family regulator
VKRKGPSGKRPPSQEASYTLSNLDQVKVLADPLRIRILEAFCEERTTKQVAELLGEKPTKLYHHVDALERVGLIRLSRTRQNRGTLEKYFLAVARSFRADVRVFQTTEDRNAGAGEQRTTLNQMMSTIFDTTAAELSRVIAEGDAAGAANAVEKAGIVSFLEIRGSKKELDEIRDKLNALIKSITADDAAATKADGAERYRLTLAYFPLDVKE